MQVSAEELHVEEVRLRYAELLQDESVFPTEANWEYIIKHRMEGLGDDLLEKYIDAMTIGDVDRVDLHNIAINRFHDYLDAVSFRYAVNVVYGNISNKEITVDLIRKHRLFDADNLAELIDCGEISMVMDVIDVYKPEYDAGDLEAMQSLLHKIDELPPRGYNEMRKGLFGTALKYICPAGHVNDAATTYCAHAGCGLDKRGFTETQSRALETFRHRIAALKSLLWHHSH